MDDKTSWWDIPFTVVGYCIVGVSIALIPILIPICCVYGFCGLCIGTKN